MNSLLLTYAMAERCADALEQVAHTIGAHGTLDDPTKEETREWKDAQRIREALAKAKAREIVKNIR